MKNMLVKMLAMMMAVTTLGSAGVAYAETSNSVFMSDTIESTVELPATDTAPSIDLGVEDKSDEKPEMTNVDVVEKCMPAMVCITNTSVTNLRDYFGGDAYFDFFFYGSNLDRDVKQVGTGSGVIVAESEDAYLIASNAHVVENATELSVAFVDESVASAEIVGIDSENDLAVIKVAKEDIDEETKKKITVIELGNSTKMRVGERVLAIGNALGYGQSVSAGIVSAKNRDIKFYENGQIVEMKEMIQTDASINPGNSGGALLNMSGELIGINAVKTSSTEIEGVGYAISVDRARPILERLANGTSETEPSDNKRMIGVMCYAVEDGILIQSVMEGSVAEKAGFKANDIILEMDGEKMTTTDDFIARIQKIKDGDVVRFKVKRVAPDAFGYEVLQEGTIIAEF